MASPGSPGRVLAAKALGALAPLAAAAVVLHLTALAGAAAFDMLAGAFVQYPGWRGTIFRSVPAPQSPGTFPVHRRSTGGSTASTARRSWPQAPWPP